MLIIPDNFGVLFENWHSPHLVLEVGFIIKFLNRFRQCLNGWSHSNYRKKMVVVRHLKFGKDRKMNFDPFLILVKCCLLLYIRDYLNYNNHSMTLLIYKWLFHRA
eukprot:TRINITY_DN42963_c0_g1_i1.p2 TRINITY_DN42963_c0_g1~~TRINITY_DN42963_c0_g1_i1.p2  ORF type:complete len:105 (+),score=8.39 TRINITY_DN42963_c0_g1_i1:187-501(+)